MRSSALLARVAAAAARRPRTVLLAVLALAVAGGTFALLTLRPSTGTDTLVGRSSATYQATERAHERFGDDAVAVLVREDLTQLVLTNDVLRLVGLEGCLSGNIAPGSKPVGGASSPCGYFARAKPVQTVYGPGTFLNEAVGEIQDAIRGQAQQAAAQAKKAGRAARKLALSKGKTPQEAAQLAKGAQQLAYSKVYTQLVKLGVRYGIGFSANSLPALNNPTFIQKLVFDTSSGDYVPKARFHYLFPSAHDALIQVRLRPDLSQSERDRAIKEVKRAVAMPKWTLPHGGSYLVTGAPVVVSELAPRVTRSLVVLLVAALLVMAGTLALVFRARRRMLPLLIALAAAGLTFGAMALAGIDLTMASIAVLPVLIGLAVDYAIQFQSRVAEERSVLRAARAGAPTIATAAAATVTGFLVLLLSPVPMVRGFGLVLVVGIVLAFAVTLTAGSAALVLGRAPRGRGPRRDTPLHGAVRGAGELLGSATQGAADLLAPLVRPVRRAGGAVGGAALRTATARPGRVLAVGLVLAAAGWALDTQTKVVSDIQKLVPQDLPALQDLNTFQQATGTSGEIDVLVTADDLTQPKAVRWMADYEQRVLKDAGYSESKGCGSAELCPALSLPDLFQGGSAQKASAKDVDALLQAVPRYFSQAVITPDHKAATLAFGIRLMPLDEQQRLVEEMRAQLDPPPGVHAELAGLPVIAAQANADVSSLWRRLVLGLLAPLVAVGLVLLAVLRSRRRALVPLVPIVLATGWSALVLFAVRIPLNPMSVTLGALVVAISTEFSVLLSERYRQERAAGAAPGEALARTYRSTGAAVAASGTTAILGFAVLIVSDIRMLRDFGIVTVVDLTVSLLGVLVALPAVLMVLEHGSLRALPARARRVLGTVRIRRRARTT